DPGGGRAARRRGLRVGVDGVVLRRLPGLPGAPLPRVLGGLLRRRLPRPARWLVGYRPARGDPHLPQLGPTTAASDLRRRASGTGGMMQRKQTATLVEEPVRIECHLDGAEQRTLAEDVLDGLTRPFKELPP